MRIEVEYTGEITKSDVETLARDLREIERADMLRQFETVDEAVRSCWSVSQYAKCIRVQGEPVAMFGIVVDEEHGHGVPWMLASDLLSFAHPVRIMREARAQLAEIVKQYPVLHNIVPVEDEEAHSLLRGLGFEVVTDQIIHSANHPYYGFWYGRAN